LLLRRLLSNQLSTPLIIIHLYNILYGIQSRDYKNNMYIIYSCVWIYIVTSRIDIGMSDWFTLTGYVNGQEFNGYNAYNKCEKMCGNETLRAASQETVVVQGGNNSRCRPTNFREVNGIGRDPSAPGGENCKNIVYKRLWFKWWDVEMTVI